MERTAEARLAGHATAQPPDPKPKRNKVTFICGCGGSGAGASPVSLLSASAARRGC